MNNFYSDKELELIKALGYIDLVYRIEPVVLYGILIKKCFQENIHGPLADSVRSISIALDKGNPYRMTKEFDSLISL